MSCDNNAALLLGGTIMAGLVSLALTRRGDKSDSSSSRVSIAVPNSMASSRAFLLTLCSQNPGKLIRLEQMLTAPIIGSQAQIDVLEEFKKFVMQKVFFIDHYNSFTFASEQLLFANSYDNNALIAFIAKCAYELQYKNFL